MTINFKIFGQIISLFVYLMVFKDTFNKISVKNRGGKFYWERKPKDLEKITDLSQVTDKL